MNGDVMTGGDWALFAASTALFIALIVWLIATALRETRDVVALTRALHAHDQDIDQLMQQAGLPPDEFEQALAEWERRP